MTRASLFAVVALTVVPSVVTVGAHDAEADIHVRLGGRARIHVRTPDVSVNWGPRRPYYAPYRPYVRGHVWVGGGYYRVWAPPPPPPPPAPVCECGPGAVPAYYHPVAPAPVAVVAAPTPRPPLRRVGIGAFFGGTDVQGTHTGDDAGLLLRLRLTPGFHIEGELASTELVDGGRIDRRFGASLIYEFGAQNNWAPYVLGGFGLNQVEMSDDSWQTNQSYGELGVGLRWALTQRFHLTADIRAGASDTTGYKDEIQVGGAASRVVPPPGHPPSDEPEEFTKLRLAAMFYF